MQLRLRDAIHKALKPDMMKHVDGHFKTIAAPKHKAFVAKHETKPNAKLVASTVRHLNPKKLFLEQKFDKIKDVISTGTKTIEYFQNALQPRRAVFNGLGPDLAQSLAFTTGLTYLPFSGSGMPQQWDTSSVHQTTFKSSLDANIDHIKKKYEKLKGDRKQKAINLQKVSTEMAGINDLENQQLAYNMQIFLTAMGTNDSFKSQFLKTMNILLGGAIGKRNVSSGGYAGGRWWARKWRR
jgi:hypothetical protein